MIKVSIMIPNYNQETLLLRALESIPKRQDIELIIIDDRSTDNSWNTIVGWTNIHKQDFGNIVIERNKENKGCGFGKNGAYTKAQGEYVITLDSDDYYYPVISDAIDYLYKTNKDLIFIDNDINSSSVWTTETRVATGCYFCKLEFLRSHNLNYDPTARRAGDGFLMKEIQKFNYTKDHIHKVIYHYNYPREGSIVGNYEHRKK